MKKILFAAFAALSMIACNKDDATTVIPDIDNTLNGAIVAMRFTDETPTRALGKIPLLALRVRVQRQR